MGDVLAVDLGAWTNQPTSFSYQWQRCDAGGNDCSTLPSGSAKTYTIQSLDAGMTIVATVTATNATGSASASSLATGLIGASGVRTFYVSFTSGDDANSGRSPSQPWKLAPGMQGFCSGKTSQAGCSTYCPSGPAGGNYLPCSGAHPGDRVILEGGDRWPNRVFPLVVFPGGAAGEPVYYGVETDWFVGSSYSRPVFDAQSKSISGWDGGSNGPHNVMVELGASDWIELDDIELTGFFADGTYQGCDIVSLNSDGNTAWDQHIIINRLYIHSFQDYVNPGGGCHAIAGGSSYPYSGDSVVENSTITGDNKSWLQGIINVGNVENNTVSGMEWLLLPQGHGTIARNELYNCGWNGSQTEWASEGAAAGSQHSDALQINGSDGNAGGSGIFYIYDNVIHDTGSGSDGHGGSGECESMLIGNPGETDYVFNNVLYNIRGNHPGAPQSVNTGGGRGFYAWNNSIEGGVSGTEPCLGIGQITVHYDFENNLCISSSGGNTGTGTDPTAGTCARAPCPASHNVLLSPSQAQTQGYTTSTGRFVWEPPMGASPTRRAGANLSGLCRGDLIALCFDTAYAQGRTSLPRPRGNVPWDVGAYQARR